MGQGRIWTQPGGLPGQYVCAAVACAATKVFDAVLLSCGTVTVQQQKAVLPAPSVAVTTIK